ncbi:amidohydrolase family protein [Paraburkholderia phosphatilytica]|uniref:amidohydrolase family protein n=1 Tax=Paraburkholderia phosphatilytica TaxID=2282883 RepID=UPI000E529BB2|nr:amidohydrolase family protein [Paraburkholderia phosphatilytica]
MTSITHSSPAVSVDAENPESLSTEWLGLGADSITAIDSHAHVFVRGLPLAAQRRHAPDYDATLDAYVAHLLANRVSHAVLVQPSFLGTDNSYLAGIARRFPARFRGVAVVSKDVSDDELDALEQSCVVGIRLNLVGLPLPDLRDASWRRLFERINARRWHVEVHRPAADLPAVVGPLLEQRCTVVVDHFGRPDTSGVDDPGFRYLLSTADTGCVWVKLSAAYRSVNGESGERQGARLAAALLDAFSEQRLVWGSDWPHTQHHDVIDYDASRHALDTWVIDAAKRHAILTHSARELFRFSDPV